MFCRPSSLPYPFGMKMSWTSNMFWQSSLFSELLWPPDGFSFQVQWCFDYRTQSKPFYSRDPNIGLFRYSNCWIMPDRQMEVWILDILVHFSDHQFMDHFSVHHSPSGWAFWEKTFGYWIWICLLFEWFWYLNVNYLDPHSVLINHLVDTM